MPVDRIFGFGVDMNDVNRSSRSNEPLKCICSDAVACSRWWVPSAATCVWASCFHQLHARTYKLYYASWLFDEDALIEFDNKKMNQHPQQKWTEIEDWSSKKVFRVHQVLIYMIHAELAYYSLAYTTYSKAWILSRHCWCYCRMLH